MKPGWAPGCCIGLLLMSATATAAPAATVAEERLSSAAQLALARQVIDICAAKGAYVAVAITSPDRVVRTLLSHDRAPAVAIEAARRKAISAALVGYPTSGLAKAAAEAPPYVDMLRSVEPALVAIGGGLPIRSGGILLGGLGVGGGRGPDADEACGAEALAKVMADEAP